MDELVVILHNHSFISKDEYYNINSTSNPINKTDMLIGAIVTSNDPKMYAKFCEGVKITKLNKLSEDLLTYLDQKNLD